MVYHFLESKKVIKRNADALQNAMSTDGQKNECYVFTKLQRGKERNSEEFSEEYSEEYSEELESFAKILF